MRRAGTLAILTALLLTALAVGTAVAADDPPHAYHRLDRISASLAKDPLFVDPDVSHALGASERARIRRAIGETSRSVGVPAYVVVVPNPSDSESQGRAEAFLFALHERSGRDGLYLMADSRGGLESEAFRVPRRFRYSALDEDQPGSWRPADYDRPFDDLAQRIVERLRSHATAPSASPTMPELYSTPDPFGKENELTPAEPEIAAPLLTGLLLVGPAAAVLLYWTGVGVLALMRRESTPRDKRRPMRQSTAWTEPSMRRLRRLAAKEVDALRQALVTADAERGRSHAVAAYDAAQILYDDAKEDEDRAVDLVGAIVLARQGQVALSRDIADPPVPCVVNPLHGDSVTRRRLAKLTHKVLPKPCPLCETCADIEKRQGLTDRHLLKVPGPGRARPHTAIPGVWRDTAWGATGKNFHSRVMRYLGVE
ncbi:hypothetical protein [Actinomadura sp. 7K534]|uniref:hypothetical protein n=1 Tax=Actinomadura sp. 7K534 TaxID=2530366 RepID=UPI0010519DEC|nr:hypothetical protein [Actinomadura sp. 7K534]TDB96856.1 hypothetical protein E1266_08665 [Actinomadura sp. 7K534]